MYRGLKTRMNADMPLLSITDFYEKPLYARCVCSYQIVNVGFSLTKVVKYLMDVVRFY